MYPAGQTGAAGVEASAPEKSASVGRQVAQLVIIPAGIVLAAIAIIYPIAQMATAGETISDQIAILQRSGGIENDRWHAAWRLATLIARLDEHDKRRSVLNRDLINLMERADPGEEGRIHRFVLLSIGRLRQPGQLEFIEGHVNSKFFRVRHAVVVSIRQWGNEKYPGTIEEARGAMDTLLHLLKDKSAEIRGLAASALGVYAKPADPGVLKALQRAMDSTSGNREATWDIAIARAKLGDSMGSAVVTDLLLDRKALARLPAEVGGSGGSGGLGHTLEPAQQDRIIIYTLSAAPAMTDPQVWAKIRHLSEKDPNRRVRTGARQKLDEHEAARQTEDGSADKR